MHFILFCSTFGVRFICRVTDTIANHLSREQELQSSPSAFMRAAVNKVNQRQHMNSVLQLLLTILNPRNLIEIS